MCGKGAGMGAVASAKKPPLVSSPRRHPRIKSPNHRRLLPPPHFPDPPHTNPKPRTAAHHTLLATLHRPKLKLQPPDRHFQIPPASSPLPPPHSPDPVTRSAPLPGQRRLPHKHISHRHRPHRRRRQIDVANMRIPRHQRIMDQRNRPIAMPALLPEIDKLPRNSPA